MSKEEAITALKDCVNELCWHCGNYKYEHKGCCDNCRWYKIKCGKEENNE